MSTLDPEKSGPSVDGLPRQDESLGVVTHSSVILEGQSFRHLLSNFCHRIPALQRTFTQKTNVS